MQVVKGTFAVKSTPQEPDALSKELGLMRLKFDKQFDGELSATSAVSMMGIMNRELNSGGYVAIEHVSGALAGKKGTFYLQHSSTLARGAAVQSITVIPDTGTGDLVGLNGHMVIDIVDGKHFYTLNYEIAATGKGG